MHSDHSVIDYVNSLLHQAIEENASDIHIEPLANSTRVRFRIDGILQSRQTLTPTLANRVTTRLKILATLNISEKRLPQDGRILYKTIDIRINCCPTIHGEKIVLRLLNANNISLEIASLGMNENQQQDFMRAINKPHGLILVTGPTGSGKTVTLYSALNYLNQGEYNITTVEDPVEITLANINQININPSIGLTFPNILRAILRQDPDIIMIGEIRDVETAIIAMQAALTGHLVLSTLHANSAIHAISRLQAMDIPVHYMLDSIELIINKRLVRKNNSGRTGIFECLTMTDDIKQLILAGKDIFAIQHIINSNGWTNLQAAHLEKIKTGAAC